MCISMPSPQAQTPAAPAQQNASDLQLGTAAIFNRASGIFGRLALTGGARGNAQVQAQRQVQQASSPTPSGSTGPVKGPGGTIGLPSDYSGAAIFGGTATPGAKVR